MTVTETRPEVAPPEAPAPATAAVPPRGLAAVLGSGDHKTIGRLWIGFSMLFLLVGLVAAVLLGFEGADLGSFDVIGAGSFLQMFTLYRVVAVFLVGIPLFIGLGTFVVPLQVGARSIALPRAASAAFWIWLVAGGIVLASYAIDGGPGGGESDGVELWIVAFGLVLVALVMASVSIATTVLAERTEGMVLTRIPLFSWSMFVAGSVWILSLPVLGANLLLAYLDHRYGQQFFGVDADLWPQVAWAFGQPQIYAVAIPALGVIGEVVPVAGDARLRHRQVAMVAIGLFGILAFGAWAQPFFNADTQDDILFIGVALTIVLPVLALIAILGESVRRRPTVNAALLFSVASLLMLLAATTAGAVSVIEPLRLIGTTFATGQMNYVLLASLLAALSGLWFWGPKIWGARLAEGPGRLAALVILLGTIVACLPDLFSGMIDQPQLVTADYAPRDGVEALNLVSALGFLLVLLGVLVAATAIVGAARKGHLADDAERESDPWGGPTLEWSTTSPPPWNNFTDDPAPVLTASPLLDLAEESS